MRERVMSTEPIVIPLDLPVFSEIERMIPDHHETNKYGKPNIVLVMPTEPAIAVVFTRKSIIL